MPSARIEVSQLEQGSTEEPRADDSTDAAGPFGVPEHEPEERRTSVQVRRSL